MSNDGRGTRVAEASRVVFFGRRCRLSSAPLRALLGAGLDVAAVIVPARHLPGRPTPALRLVEPGASRSRLPIASRAAAPTVDDMAHAAGLPLVEVGGLRLPEVVDFLASLSAAVFSVSCFPFRLPSAALRLPTQGALNAHPSLLPRHRGPDPLFWTYREFDHQAGVSVHLITDNLDAGDVVAQRAVDLPPGLPGDELEAACSRLAADLLLDATRAALLGTLRPGPQREAEATYEGWPRAADMRIDPGWTAARACHFARGVIPLGYEPTLRIDGQDYRVRQALDCRAGDTATAETERNFVTVPWHDGVLRVRLAPRHPAAAG